MKIVNISYYLVIILKLTEVNYKYTLFNQFHSELFLMNSSDILLVITIIVDNKYKLLN